MRPDAEAFLRELLDSLKSWRSHDHQRALYLARAEGAVAAYWATGILSTVESEQWLDQYRTAAVTLRRNEHDEPPDT